nr:hypothetical protein [Candidatus Woesearchaeota archaeon]
MKGQITIEYMMLVGVFFFLVITIFYFATTESVKTIQSNKADNVVNSLAKTADYLYTLGPGSGDSIEIDMPGNVNSIMISNKEIIINMGIYGGISDISATTKANVTGSISTSRGINHVNLKVLDNGVVQIED